MRLKANAKINLGLYITGVNENKYHLLDATMLPITLYDEIEINISKYNQDNVSIENMDIPKENTITKAINLLRDHYKFNVFFDIKVKKGIPSGAGLGGGSSDAAFVINGIKELLNLDCSYNNLKEIALKVGADVPFFLVNKPSRMQGIGDILTPFEIKKNYSFLLIKPKFGISTIESYKKYDELRKYNKSNIDTIIELLKNGKELNNVHNDLWESARIIQPKMVELENLINKYQPILLTMSGSGSTLIVYDDIEKLKLIKINILATTDLELCEIVDLIK